MIPVIYKLRNIKPDVPLYDEKNKTFTIIVDDEIVEIPEDTFKKLFKEVDNSENRTQEVITPILEKVLESGHIPIAIKIEKVREIPENNFRELVNILKSNQEINNFVNVMKSLRVPKEYIKEQMMNFIKNSNMVPKDSSIDNLKYISDKVIDILME
jgi:hypothetical protein